MSGELARAVRDDILADLAFERTYAKRFSPPGTFWYYAVGFPRAAVLGHVNAIDNDERVPIPQRGTDG